MSDAHSPGPWSANVDAADDLELRSPDGTIIAIWYPRQEVSKANFALLLAAPEMAALLREVEWAGENASCVVCGSYQPMDPRSPPAKHNGGCSLGALLARLPPAPEGT